MIEKILSLVLFLFFITVIVFFFYVKSNHEFMIDRYKGVIIYDNGKDIQKSHGRHFSKTGYYFGQKWQCVEFVKRFYFEVKQHEMPNVYGHAISFYDKRLKNGQINKARGLIQFRNGSYQQPRKDDLLVLALSQYGHVGIISKVGKNSIEMVQQNNGPSRITMGINKRGGRYYLQESYAPLAWLRMPP